MRNAYGTFPDDLKAVLAVDGRLILKLKLIRKKQDKTAWSGRICPGQGPVAGCCTHGTEISGSIKEGEFTDKLSESAPWC
jgi:hypothetical protein